MTDEDLIDCIMELDEVLAEAEEALEAKKYAAALEKIKQARDTIEDLRKEDEADDDRQSVEMNVMNKLR